MADLQHLLREAQRSSSDAFCARYPHPALVLDVRDDDASFSTAVGIDTAPNLASGGSHTEGRTVHFVIKSQRNPYADRISVGRAANCDIIVRDPSISKLHAHFLKLPGGWLGVRDARSTNGVFVEGARLPPDEVRRVDGGARIRFGTVEAQLLYPAALYDFLRGRPPTP